MGYLPHILREIVQKVSDKLEEQVGGEVFFEYGLYQDVSRAVGKRKDDGREAYPIVWLPMPLNAVKSPGLGVSDAFVSDLFILTSTDTNFTVQQREQSKFISTLFPIRNELLKQIAKSRSLFIVGSKPKCDTPKELFYWGGDETGNNNSANFSKHFVDAVQIPNIEFLIKRQIYSTT